MPVRVGVNGFGRIGRQIVRAAYRDPDLEFVAVNDITDAPTLAHLFKHDSIHGTFKDDVRVDGSDLVIGGRRVKVLAVKNPAELPWKDLGVEYVLESTGLFRDVHAATHAINPRIDLRLNAFISQDWELSGIDFGAESKITDAGDLPPVPAPAMNAEIERGIAELLDRGLRPIALGGDHSITYPAVKAVAGKHGGLTILQFDAHPDLYEEFEGNPYSHACPFARILEQGLAKRLVQAGARAITGHHREQAKRYGVEIIEMKDWRDRLPDLDSPLYISFDLDALDPAFAPGVVHREPGGLSVRQAITAIQDLRAEVVAADIVELNPRLDPAHLTGGVAAKLLKEIAAKMVRAGA